MRRGLDKEDVARKQYQRAIKTVHVDFRVRKSGLLIDTRKSFLEAPSDGIREYMCCGEVPMDIKCQFINTRTTRSVRQPYLTKHFV